MLVLRSASWRGWGELSAGANTGRSSPCAGLCSKAGSSGSGNTERDISFPMGRRGEPLAPVPGPLKRNEMRGRPPARCCAAAARSGCCCRAALLPAAARQRCRRQPPRCRLAQAQPPPRACRGGGSTRHRQGGLCAPRGSPQPTQRGSIFGTWPQGGRGGGHGPLLPQPWVPWGLLRARCRRAEPHSPGEGGPSRLLLPAGGAVPQSDPH